MRLPNPFANPKRNNFTLFDLSYMSICMVMLAQATVFLSLARDNLLIFVEEHCN